MMHVTPPLPPVPSQAEDRLRQEQEILAFLASCMLLLAIHTKELVGYQHRLQIVLKLKLSKGPTS